VCFFDACVVLCYAAILQFWLYLSRRVMTAFTSFLAVIDKTGWHCSCMFFSIAHVASAMLLVLNALGT